MSNQRLNRGVTKQLCYIWQWQAIDDALRSKRLSQLVTRSQSDSSCFKCARPDTVQVLINWITIRLGKDVDALDFQQRKVDHHRAPSNK
jgi:hypothetical protein